MNVADRIDWILRRATDEIKQELSMEGVPFEQFEDDQDRTVLQYELGAHGEVYNVIVQQEQDGD